MAQPGSDSPLSGAWPGGLIIALLAAMGILGLVQAPLKPERPAEPKAGLRVVGDQDVDARLWQDPFAAVDDARQADKSPATSRSIEVAENGIPSALTHCRPPKATVEGSSTDGGSSRRPPGPDPGGRSRRVISSSAATSGNTGLSNEGGAGNQGASNLGRSTFTRHSLAELRCQIAGRLTDDGSVIVLGVMVSGGPSTGAAESRRRRRYAAISALMQEELEPQDSAHIGYVEIAQSGLPPFVPYEWFSPVDSGAKRDLLLLWLDDDTLAARTTSTWTTTRSPLRHLADLLSQLVDQSASKKNLSFRIIGPASSGTLLAMVAEAKPCAGDGTDAEKCPASKSPEVAKRATWDAQVWSPFATAPLDKGALTGLRPVIGYGGKVQVVAPDERHRTIASDDTLAELLVEELKQRHIGAPAEVALIGQWDTRYSRILTTAVRQVLGDKSPDIKVVDHRYLRGIDGLVPSGKAKDKEMPDREAQAPDRPGGDSQVDYLQRLRNALLDEDARERRDCGLLDRFQQRCGIRAIGVFGDDYYDKLLVLQALKPVFPNALFFTTDLAADMFLPRDNVVTRNLIVASGYGLTLSPEWQGAVPPLRDSYQTAVLLTVRLAVRDARAGRGLSGVQTPPPPRLFEVGRSRPVELPPYQDAKFVRWGFESQGSEGSDPHPAAELSMHYGLGPTGLPLVVVVLGLVASLGIVGTIVRCRGVGEGDGGSWGNVRDLQGPALMAGALLLVFAGILILQALGLAARTAGTQLGAEVLALLAGIWLLGTGIGWVKINRAICQWWQHVREPSQKPGHYVVRLTAFVIAAVIGAVIAVVAAVFGALWWDLTRGGEPFSLIEGVSVWPSEVLRLVAGILASYLLVRGYSRHMASLGKIEQRFQGLGRTRRKETEAACRGAVGNAAEKVWAFYRSRCEGKAVVKRVAMEAAGLFILALAMMVAWGLPNHPTHGPIAWWVDVGLIFVILVPFLALLFYMVDATRQARDLARELEKGVIWPDSTLTSRHLCNWVKNVKDAKFARDPVILDVELVGAATAPVGNLVWHPILILIVIAVSRLPLFDAWNLPVPLLVVMGLALTYAVTSAWRLRRAAEAVRSNAIRKLTEELRRLRDQPDTDGQIKRVEEMLREVRATEEGAFRPFSRQPVVQAILTLISSLTGIAVLQYSSLVNL